MKKEGFFLVNDKEGSRESKQGRFFLILMFVVCPPTYPFHLTLELMTFRSVLSRVRVSTKQAAGRNIASFPSSQSFSVKLALRNVFVSSVA